MWRPSYGSPVLKNIQLYHGVDSVGPLEAWPFDNPRSQYVIVDGSPSASGRLDFSSEDGSARAGVWRCTPGIFECTELGDELQTLVSGRLVLTIEGQPPIECVTGDSVFTRKGQRVRWDIRETVIKIFHTSNLDADE